METISKNTHTHKKKQHMCVIFPYVSKHILENIKKLSPFTTKISVLLNLDWYCQVTVSFKYNSALRK